MQIIECEQGSETWIKARLGIPTASNFARVVDCVGKPSKQQKKYMYDLAAERLTNIAADSFVSFAMQKGKDHEKEARELYEIVKGEDVSQVGFCILTEENLICGASPDGLIGKDGGLEIKCPLMGTHLSYLINGEISTEYYQQLQGNLMITGRKWWDFISYFPGINPLIVRVFPDLKFHVCLKEELKLFCSRLDDLVKQSK